MIPIVVKNNSTYPVIDTLIDSITTRRTNHHTLTNTIPVFRSDMMMTKREPELLSLMKHHTNERTSVQIRSDEQLDVNRELLSGDSVMVNPSHSSPQDTCEVCKGVPSQLGMETRSIC